MSAIGAGILGGAVGGGLAVTVLAPLTAANNFLGSYFFGSGMILGERQMYQDDWIKIKERLDKGESFLVILEEVMKPNTQAVMQMARETVIAVSAEWNDIVLKYLQSIPQSIWDAINKISAGQPTDNPWPLGEGVIGNINGKVQCAQGYFNPGNNTCVKNVDAGKDVPPDIIPVPIPKITPDEKLIKFEKTYEQLVDTSVVPSGATRAQLIAAIKFHEIDLGKKYETLAKIKVIFTKNPISLNKTQVAIRQKFVDITIRVIAQYKAALNYISSKNLKVTP